MVVARLAVRFGSADRASPDGHSRLRVTESGERVMEERLGWR